MTWRALSMTAPWGWLAVQPGAEFKSVENRKWNTFHRGEFLFHSALKCAPADWQICFDWVRLHIGEEMACRIPKLEELPRGGIIGRAVIRDVLPKSGQLTITPTHTPGVDLRWWMRGQYGFVLTDRATLPFIECKGAVNLWNVPADVGARVDEVLGRKAA